MPSFLAVKVKRTTKHLPLHFRERKEDIYHSGIAKAFVSWSSLKAERKYLLHRVSLYIAMS
jgi:hypothetical protein